MILRQCRYFEVTKYDFGAMIYLLLSKLCKVRLWCGTKVGMKIVVRGSVKCNMGAVKRMLQVLFLNEFCS